MSIREQHVKDRIKRYQAMKDDDNPTHLMQQEIRRYYERIHELKTLIKNRQKGMIAAQKLFERNRQREQGKINDMKDQIERIKHYVTLFPFVVCPICYREFKNAKGLTSHMTQAHKEA